jgi:hypothetical protein
MPEKEFENQPIKSITKHPPISSKTPTLEQLLAMPSDQLIKMLLSPEIAKSENAPLRQQIIRLLQEKKGNAFVQSLLGGKSSGK